MHSSETCKLFWSLCSADGSHIFKYYYSVPEVCTFLLICCFAKCIWINLIDQFNSVFLNRWYMHPQWYFEAASGGTHGIPEYLLRGSWICSQMPIQKSLGWADNVPEVPESDNDITRKVDHSIQCAMRRKPQKITAPCTYWEWNWGRGCCTWVANCSSTGAHVWG